MTEAEQIARAQKGNELALEEIMTRYKSLVLIIARRYFLIGADADDVVQEGMIGLYKSLVSYSPEKGLFRNFAAVCIKRQILTAVRRSSGKAQSVLNDSVRLGGVAAATLESLIDGAEADPESALILQEEKTERFREINKNLSGFEQKVLSLYLEGDSYTEIAAAVGTEGAKNIDNAITRIKNKLKKVI